MRNIFIIGLLFFAGGVSAQWIDPWQIRPAPDSNMVLGSITPWNDAAWIYRDSLLKGVSVKVDSIFLRNDTIYLRDGSGFVKVTFDSLNNRGQLSLSNDTLYYKPCATCAVWYGKLPTGGGGGTENTTDELQDLYPYSTGFVLSNPTVPLQDTVLFQYTTSIVTTPPTGCNCSVEDIPTLSTQLAGKANVAHLHSIAEVTGLLGALDGKANTTHTHVIGDVTGLQTALDGKENAFAKGSLVAGTNVTLSGTLTNRLVGSGDVTINATGGGSTVTVQENVNTSPPSLTSTMQSICALTLTAGTYLLNANLSGQVLSGTISGQLFDFTNNSILARASSSETITTISLVKTITLAGTATIQLRASGNGNTLYGSSQGTQILTALKIN